MTRLFAGVWPPAPLAERLAAMPRPERAGVRWTTSTQWHVTLRFFGSVDPGRAAALERALASMTWPSSPVVAMAGPRPLALGRHVWMLPVEGLGELAAAIGSATEPIVSRTAEESGRRFRGHLTLARIRSGTTSGLPLPDLSCSWVVGRVTLVASELHPDGARYRIVGRWGPGAE